MAESEDSKTSHDTKTATLWGIVLCVMVMIIIAVFCIYHWVWQDRRLRQTLERAQLSRRRTTAGLGRDAVENMTTIIFDSRMHSKTIPTLRIMKSTTKLAKLQRCFSTPSVPRRSLNPDEENTGQLEESTRPACSICTEDFENGARLRRVPCGHLFHPECIDPWLTRRSRTCPLW